MLMQGITLSDTTAALMIDEDGQSDYCTSFHVNAAGNLKLTLVDSSSGAVTIPVVAGKNYPYSVRLFWSTGSDAVGVTAIR
jgi:myo-inositol-hexaphosphate 3-phosphohydrolase